MGRSRGGANDYLGLYAQQHRGQESSGIVSLHQGDHLHHKGMGLVGDVFREADLIRLEGDAAIGHNRYSTTGGSCLQYQPLTAQLLNGPIAIAHNGNVVNGDVLRAELKKQGSIFQSTTHSECLLHLLAKNPSNDLITCLKDSLPKLVGAYSMVSLTNDRLVAARDPLGFDP